MSKITIKDNVNKTVIVLETPKRNEEHFKIQLKTRSIVYKAKKGKGSYKRKSKYKDIWF